MMWHAGLRGGIAMALVLEMKDDSKHEADKLRVATFFVTCLSLVALGGSTQFFLKRLGVQMGCQFSEEALVHHYRDSLPPQSRSEGALRASFAYINRYPDPSSTEMGRTESSTVGPADDEARGREERPDSLGEPSAAS